MATVALESRNEVAIRLSGRGRAIVASATAAADSRVVEAAAAAGQFSVLLGSNLVRIGPDEVELRSGNDTLRLANDSVIVCTGGILSTGFLRSIGIDVETKHGTT